MLNNHQTVIQKAEQYIRRYASMMGHDDADTLMQLVQLAKKQEIELSRFSSTESDDKKYTQLVFENAELTNFKESTKEIVGDVILDLIEQRMAD